MSILKLAIGAGVFVTVAVTSILYFKDQPAPVAVSPEVTTSVEAEIPAEINDATAASETADSVPSSEEALNSVVNNDKPAFENYIRKGGKLNSKVEVSGKKQSIGELMVKYERKELIEIAKNNSVDLDDSSNESGKEADVYSAAVSKNNPEVLSLLVEGKEDVADKTYGANKRSLLHQASSENAVESTKVLHEKAGMSWDKEAQDGSTPLTVAAEADSVETLNYWKKQGADFKAKDGRGKSALDIMKSSKNPAVVSLAKSLSGGSDKAVARKAGSKNYPASKVAMNSAKPKAAPNFYKRRNEPLPRLARKNDLLEPENRPDDANETANHSEFSD